MVTCYITAGSHGGGGGWGGHHGNSDDDRVDLQLKPQSVFCKKGKLSPWPRSEPTFQAYAKTHWTIVMDVVISASWVKVGRGCARPWLHG